MLQPSYEQLESPLTNACAHLAVDVGCDGLRGYTCEHVLALLVGTTPQQSLCNLPGSETVRCLLPHSGFAGFLDGASWDSMGDGMAVAPQGKLRASREHQAPFLASMGD